MRKVHPAGPAEIASLGDRGLFTMAIAIGAHWTNLEGLLRKYSDRSISFADACLIRCAEIHQEPRILTFNTDFSIYKWGRNRRFEIL